MQKAACLWGVALTPCHLCELFGTGSLKVLATISWIGCLFKYANSSLTFCISVPPTHTLHTFSFNHTLCRLSVSTTHTVHNLYMPHKPIHSQSTST